MAKKKKSDLLYTQEHEWVSVEDDVATCGISDYAQQQLGDVVFVELPEVGKTVAQSEEIAVVESVKAASDIYAPISGEVIEVNDALEDEPGLVNGDPTGEGWFFRLRIENPEELEGLMDEDAYQDYVEGLD